jgi:hypothetical protein
MKFIKLTDYNNNQIEVESDFNKVTYITLNPAKIIDIKEHYRFNTGSGFETNEHIRTSVTTSRGVLDVIETSEEIIALCNADMNLKHLKATMSMRQEINTLEDEIKDLKEANVDISKKYANYIIGNGAQKRHPEESLATLEIFNNALFKGQPDESPIQRAVLFAHDYITRHSYGVSGLASPEKRLKKKED